MPDPGMQAAAGTTWAVAGRRPLVRRRQTRAVGEESNRFEGVGRRNAPIFINNPLAPKKGGRDLRASELGAFVREASSAETLVPLRSNRGIVHSIIHRAPARWAKRDEGRWLILADAALNGDVSLAKIEELAGKIEGPSSPLLDMESTSSVDQVDASGMLNEYSDQDGNRFNVYLSNSDAPVGMTKLEVRGTDRANLLGSLCTSLARMEISIVSGIVSTGNDGIVRNTLFVRRQDRDDGNAGIIIGGRLEEEDFGPVSLQVLSACWTSEERDWLKTRSGGRFVSNRRQPAPFGPGQIGKTERLMAAEARMRAVSARMADVNLALDASALRLAETDPDKYDDMFTELTESMNELADAKAEARRLTWSTMNASIDFETMQAKKGDEEGAAFGITPFVKGVLFMNLAALLFGSNQVVIKQVTDTGLDDFTQMFLRFGIASFMLLPFVYKGVRSPQGTQMAAASFQLGSLLAIGYLLQIIGIDGTTAARGALTSTFTVLSVPVFANLSGQRVPWYTWPASLMGVVGVALLTNSGGDPTYADALCVLSATVFGYHMHVSGVVAPKFEDQELPFVAMQLGVVGVEAGIFKLGEIIFESHRGGPDLATVIANIPDTAGDIPWAPLVYMGVVTTALTLYVEFIAFQSIPASLAALIYTAEPLWGAAFAWQFMGDRWGGIGWVGAGMIVCATVGSQYLSFKEDVETDESAPAALP